MQFGSVGRLVAARFMGLGVQGLGGSGFRLLGDP